MVGAPPPSGGYRDERDAALAQTESLRQQVSSLESELQRLRAENEMFRRELGRYTGQPYAQRRSSAGAIIAFAVLAFMFLGGVAGFVLLRSSAPQPVPVSVVEPAMPSSAAPVPSTPQPVPVPVSASPISVDPAGSVAGT